MSVASVLPDTEPVRCARCGQRLLLSRPGRTVCERCRLNPAGTPARPAATPTVRQPSTCAGCGAESFAIADGHCMTCRHTLGMTQPNSLGGSAS
jgi:ribosomal protein L37E